MSIERSRSCPLDGEITHIMHFETPTQRANFIFPSTPAEESTPREDPQTAKAQKVAKEILHVGTLATAAPEQESRYNSPAVYPCDF